MTVSKQQVVEALAKVPTPRGVPLPQAGVLSEIAVTDGKVFFSISVDAAEARAWEDVRARAEAAVKAIPGLVSVMVALTAERKPGAAPAPRPAGGVQPVSAHRPHSQSHGHGAPAQSPMSKQADIPGVAAIIAVASGKGGVGKSTTALNIALGLRDQGLRVGLLDADIYGPSIPRLTGLRDKPQLDASKKMIPLSRFGLAIMSIGFLVEEETAMIWRGPMVMSAITQMLRDVAWGTLDVLVVDMPPGTGDAQLTLAQAVPLKGAIIVSTPQDLALIDARRGIAMFRKVNVPVLGIVENMSYFQCPECGTRSDIFGHGGARHEAERVGVPFLGEVPLHMAIRSTSDAGTPVVESEPQGVHAGIYRAIGAKVRDELKPYISAA
ncbi:Mrp/NBP35 family ATP-binding protein [Bradyrhizobium sp. U87765 SZCCT0131]|uniref:Mrp/NBP35 family ATP-binding protein n=1 Tax=unclassified Bradyrhizobium TaxID=2631580 RepID=UPI001BA807A2|nr:MULTISPECIES: Mrp/NBP35 family ATP-binding protein [unclassified Bradyrhizobium]MBR1221453.1 Mrp/NBP35 family ATP-binding protein [Bradyrhizobium sp. U87765 SZCCT0131]MBR1264624.1 Mrp/NBP35 family ATP-binding protein [Bradyrhizobium sp. U87765 SZCCT0134]MBR1304470.1 Mrp/NBP35 family ATP-binding protein [Bradyrhizobium sp. U87765 SZCCT0110]MBR1322673.1 Mrp/NBP35 family ATP-binding protein [Bradyrhizobium sp. U87765 SZCCT0109]MBR1346399.1 Mrp/NBP35 family ATP-binding protein [Bradyrhizobium s